MLREKIIAYIMDELPFVTEARDSFSFESDHILREYTFFQPWRHDPTLSDNSVIMGYIRPIVNKFREEHPETREYCVVVTIEATPDSKTIVIAFEPRYMPLAEITAGYIANKYRSWVVGIGEGDEIVATSDIEIPDRVLVETDFILTGFVDPVTQGIWSRLPDGDYLISCESTYDPAIQVSRLKLRFSEKPT